MNANSSPPPVPVQPFVLQYADAAAWHGMLLHATEDGLKITLYRGGFAVFRAALTFALFAGVVIPFGVFARRRLPAEFAGFELAVITVMLAIVGAAIRLFVRTKPAIIEITGDALIFQNVLPNESFEMVRPRSEVYDVSYDERWRSLVAKCYTMNVIECRLNRDPAVLRWLAQVLREALKLQNGRADEPVKTESPR